MYNLANPNHGLLTVLAVAKAIYLPRIIEFRNGKNLKRATARRWHRYMICLVRRRWRARQGPSPPRSLALFFTKIRVTTGKPPTDIEELADTTEYLSEVKAMNATGYAKKTFVSEQKGAPRVQIAFTG